VGIPQQLRAGDTITWIEPAGTDSAGAVVSSTTHTASAFLRFNKAAEGVTVTGTARTDGGWDFTISATTSGTMDAGTWYAQTRATLADAVVTLSAGTFEVLASLSYSGTPGAFDGRSAAATELAEVRAAIRTIISGGVTQYSIGSRSATKIDLGRLMQRESQLKAIVAKEQAAERIAAGLGDPRNLFVRFG
jgi:hypothetical protein